MRGKESTLDMLRCIPFYKKIWQEAASLNQASFLELEEGIWKVDFAGESTLINNFKVQIDNPVILDIAGNKGLCYRLLTESGLPVPEYQVLNVYRLEEAKKIMMAVDYTSAEEAVKTMKYLLGQPEDVIREFGKYIKF